MREALKARNLSLWEAFTAFDNDNNGLLSPAEFYGALLWLQVPNLTAEDVVDFLEAADTNRDGVVDYKEYVDMIAPPGSVDAVESDPGTQFGDVEEEKPTTALAKVEPFGGEQLREVIVHRRQNELLRLREERVHLTAYKEALDIKVFEEELLQSRKRKGGANPLVSSATVPFISNGVRQVDFKFFTNQHPLRLAASGKNAFFPVHIGTAANRPVQPMNCPKKHGLFACNYSWMNCTNCRGRGVAYVCTCWCGFYLCANCYDGDRRAKEADRVNPAKHPTFLKCYNGCSFTLQIPSPSIPIAISNGFETKDDETVAFITDSPSDQHLDFTITLELRVDKLPPNGHSLSLLRFTVPGLVPSRKKSTTNLSIDSNGRVICLFPTEKNFPVNSTLHDMVLEVPAPPTELPVQSIEPAVSPTQLNTVQSVVISKPQDASTSDTETVIVEKTPLKPIEKVLPVAIRPSTWHVITVSVRPLEGSMCSFIDGNLCHTFSGHNIDVNNLKLQHKLTALGGGRQAEARGADIRRLVIHDRALGGECHAVRGDYKSDRRSIASISALPLDWLYVCMAHDHPAIGGRALRIQTVYRGFIVRRRAKKLTEEVLETVVVPPATGDLIEVMKDTAAS